jgi:hypothetical protein
MIDTVRVKFPASPTSIQLHAWDRQTRTKATGEIRERYTYNAALTTDEISIRSTFFPLAYDGNPLLTIELSLPKAVHGNNFSMIPDIPTAIDCANSLLSQIDALPPLDIGQGVLIRIDPCYNHTVGSLVPDYINAIAQLEYPHRRTKHHRDEGAEFRSKHVTTKFYDKMRETCDPSAYGILRQETTFLKAKRIAKLFGKKNPTLQDVTPEWAAAVLNDDLEKLRLNGRPIADRDTALATLCHHYGPDAGIYYWALLQSKSESGTRQLRTRTGLHPRSLDRRLRKIIDAGIAPTLTDSTEPLPPLVIDL